MDTNINRKSSGLIVQEPACPTKSGGVDSLKIKTFLEDVITWETSSR